MERRDAFRDETNSLRNVVLQFYLRLQTEICISYRLKEIQIQM